MTEANLISNELSIKDLENNDEYWIGDTGATTHMTNIQKEYIIALILMEKPK